MDQLRYRSKARVIAIVDLILTSMTLLIPIVFFFGAIGMTVVSQNDEMKSKLAEEHPELADISNDEDATGALATIMWIGFIITAAVVIVQLVAAVKLINATQLGKDAIGAAKLSRFWRNVTIVFTILMVFSSFRENRRANMFMILFNWGSIVLRLLGIYVVQQFINELDQASVSGILPTHQGQVPMSAGMAYSYIPPQQNSAPPPNYNEVVKEPFEKQ